MEWYEYVRWEIVFVLIAIFVTTLMVSMFWIHHLQNWRVRWIEMEHELAKKEDREPRSINIFGNKS